MPLAQDSPHPRTGFRPPAIAFTNLRIVRQPGDVIACGNLVLRNGRIEQAGPDAPIPVDARVIDATGLTAYPGFIDAATASLIDPDALKPDAGEPPPDFRQNVLAGSPTDQRRGITPEFKAHEHLLRSKALLEPYRKAGFTTAHVAPLRPIAGGQGCLLALGDGPLDEAAFTLVPDPLRAEVSSIFKLEALPVSGSATDQYPITTMGAVARLRQAFLDARQHSLTGFPSSPAGLNRPHDAGRAGHTLFLADSADEIDRALAFLEEFALVDAAIVGARDAALRIDRLKAAAVGVVLRVDNGAAPTVEPQPKTESLTPDVKPPLRVQEDAREKWKGRMTTAARLAEAGLPFAFTSLGCSGPDAFLSQLRGLVAEGVPADTVLGGLTRKLTSVEWSWRDAESLEPGRRAHVTIMNGPWEATTTKVRYVVIGEELFEYNRDAEPAKPEEPSAVPPPQIAGTWNVSIAAGEMKTTAATLALTQDGERLGGTFSSEAGDGNVISGHATAGNIEFAVAIGAGQRDVTLHFEGTYDSTDEALSGTMRSPFGPPTDWKATRTPAPEQPANPVTIRLEDDANPQASDNGELPSELESDRLAAAGPAEHDLLLQNGTVLTGTGQMLTDTDVLIREGKIAAIAPDLAAEPGVRVIDVAGWYVMPGIIDTHSHIMIAGGVNEASHSVVPEVRIRDVLRTDDVHAYRALAGGVTTARLLHGSSNTIGGQDVVVKLRYGEPAAVQIVEGAPQGVKFALGENVKGRSDRFPKTRMGVEATLKRSFYEALDYRRQWQQYEQLQRAAHPEPREPADDGEFSGSASERPPAPTLPEPRRDLRLEQLVAILEGRSVIHCHCYRADEILMLLSTADELGIRVRSLQHVLEGYKIAPEIVAHGASCSTFSDWWAYKIEAFDATPFNTTLLWRAGANVVVKSDNPELMRHLPFEAAKSLRYGNMPEDAALAMVTRNAARELGLADRIGSIEVGKDGDLAVFNGHPFNPFSRCELTIIEGQVRFCRAAQPTAMSAASQERSRGPHPLHLAPAEIRQRGLALPDSEYGRYALCGGTIHPVDAPELLGTVVIEDGRIAALGPEIAVPPDATVIDVSGLHLYPGLIDAGTTLGINEIRVLEVTHDFAETGRIQPDVRAAAAVHADSELIPVSRAGGITTTLVRPNGTLVAGQCAIVQLAGWTSPEMILDPAAGLAIDWPGDEAAQDELRNFLADARVYERVLSQPETSRPAVVRDPRYEAMRPYLRGERPLFIEAHERKAIAQALLFAEREQLRIVVTGATDAWKLADELKARDVPVIIGPVMREPIETWDPFDAPYANAARLYEAGVRFCIRSNDSSNSRNAPFHAAIAVAYGLPEEEALKAVTLSAASILGIDGDLGSITPGKRASLIVTDGSPLQPTTQIKAVFVAGRVFAPESKQTRLYERYSARLPAAPQPASQ